jgi:hypothetical protein
MLEALKTIKIVEPHTRKIISCDPALTGDKCVARAMINCKTVKRIEMYYRDTMKIVGDLIILSNETGINNFIIDTCNLGKTIADRLSEIGKNKKLNYDIQYFNSAEKASDPQRFANIKAEMWWYIKEQVDAMRIPYPDEPVLLKQIPAASRYDTVSSDGKIRMQLKGKVRKQLGCSPDDAESWGYGVWGTQFVEPEVEIQPDRVRRRNRYGKTSAMAL